MFNYPYAKPSVTATVFAIYNGMLVVGTRSDWIEAYPGKKCVPGGFLEASYEGDEGETVEQTAIREFEEECGVTLSGDQLILFHEHSNPLTDPRCHVVNLCYIANLNREQMERLMPGDDLKALDLVMFEDITEEDQIDSNWAFNHFELARLAIHVWRNGGDFFQSKGIWS
jgi:ADP-ribose pyrophosphatase YjhB (NUDIX family)